jgi:hypothetical protein
MLIALATLTFTHRDRATRSPTHAALGHTDYLVDSRGRGLTDVG